jgi:predicted small secreted protein
VMQQSLDTCVSDGHIAREYIITQEELQRRNALRVIQEHYTGMLGVLPGSYTKYDTCDRRANEVHKGW